MVKVTGVRFKKAGKIYYFSPNEIQIEKGNYVIVETSRGIEFGEAVIGTKEIRDEEIVSPLKSVIRKATNEDIEHHRANKEKEKEAFEVCLEKIEKHQLDMKLIDVEFTFDNNKIIFYFTAEGRVDFRELVKDLAGVFRTRIELRQIGVRDEAKMVGGLGPCGRTLCCSSFLGEFAPVSIKMAKEQNLSLNPSKISGLCGRLMCCLTYEQDTYTKIRDKMPKVGSIVKTPYGEGVVIENNVIKEIVKVKMKLEDDVEDIKSIKIDKVVLIEGSYEIENSDDDIKLQIDGDEDHGRIKELFKEN